MADETETADMRGKAIRVHLGVEGQSVRDHTAGSGVASEETTPVPADQSEAYSDGDWHDTEGSLSDAYPPSPIESVDGDGSEMEVRVEALEDNEDGISEPEVVAESPQPSERRSERTEGSERSEIPDVQVADVDAVSDNEINQAHELPADDVSRDEEIDQVSEDPMDSDPVNKINESNGHDSHPSTPVMPARPESNAKHPGLTVPDPVESVEAQAEASHAEETPVAPAPQQDSEPSPEEPIEESPDEPEDEHAEEGYTSASHSYHPSDSEGYSDGEEALQAELASKEDEHGKLASQLQLMQQEMEALRKMLEQNQQELATSSQELEKARAELNDLRKQQNESAAKTQAERDAFRQVEKLMKEKKSLREQLEKMQDQMQRMESLQQQLERRLQATERERDAVKQRLQVESWKPHRIEEAEAARRRTGGEFRVLEKQIEKRIPRPPREKQGAHPKDVWRFQPRQRGALVLRVRPGLDSPRSNQKLYPGDSFVVSEQRKGPSDLVFLKLADGRGWAFNRSPDVGTLCVPRPARKDRLAPYRLPEGVRLPGKLRQDQAIRSRPRLPAIPKPVRDSRAPWH
mmetsp:Transcript_61382/g.100363  ORF Transcript_61382/g.100363 Transcript_61382/m.100363 type:complete len:576 (-) Transcript_61382:108-1835(-)